MNIKNVTILILIITTFFTIKLNAQSNLKVTTNADDLEIGLTLFKPLTQDYKLTLFSLNEAGYSYDNNKTEFMTYNIISYDVYKGIAPTIGTRFIKQEFVDKAVLLGGLGYTYAKEKFFMTTVFTSEFQNNPDYEFFITSQYRPKLTEKLIGYFEFESSMNFNSQSHLFSFQKFRLGVDFKKLQAGFSLDNYQYGKNWEYEFKPGVFVQLTL
ncbi:hypothetical protein WH52_09480 [Tenacibaculum holothuriorum]|uniref:DUF481 domain-containing protein n=1 Tax=Tenacibaculum holothuriorum TaxID=1635173 RepID=A0A1Y2PD44_9FLAO|nr:hypothetical protein [Tenacibaculum holothuriorum]OSY87659.1 hypothetical protein WH52_09480 [Tenacibaculum holothuriorum]